MRKKITLKKIILFLMVYGFHYTILAQNCTSVEELLRKRHTISGMTYGHPYTTFDRHNENYKTLQNAIENIRQNIVKDKNISGDDKLRGPIYKAYQAIYINAIESKPTDNGLGNYTEVSKLAEWAKDNAFVFLVGMNASGQLLDEIDITGVTRDAFRYNAQNAFVNLTGEIDADNPSLLWWLFPPAYWAANIAEEQKYLTKLKFHSRSLMLWLQNYDLLKAAYELKTELRDKGRNPYGFGDADKSDLDCSPRNKLRKLTRDLYYYSEGNAGIVQHITGWKKNHGIASASCLLMAAQVLNDAGVETNYANGILGWLWGEGFVLPYPKYSPINWNNLGQVGITDNIFSGTHLSPFKSVPQSPINNTDNSYSVYAEGTQYVDYGLLDCGIPAMVAQKNITNILTKNTHQWVLLIPKT